MRRTRDSAQTPAAPARVSTFVVAQVRQTPQHACAAGASSAARFTTGRAFACVRSSMVLSVWPLPGQDALRPLSRGANGRRPEIAFNHSPRCLS